jgi:hypothetical protein
MTFSQIILIIDSRSNVLKLCYRQKNRPNYRELSSSIFSYVSFYLLISVAAELEYLHRPECWHRPRETGRGEFVWMTSSRVDLDPE